MQCQSSGWRFGRLRSPVRRTKLTMFDKGSVLQTVSDVGSIVEQFSKPAKLQAAMGWGLTRIDELGAGARPR